MGQTSTIEWTDATWNPVTGCAKVSQGCKHCYAETIANRFWKDRKFTDVRCHPERLEQPLRWRKPRRVFVNSMSDLFHPDVPDEFIGRVWEVMDEAGDHVFQILTKRPERARKWITDEAYSYLGNVWLGVSVEDQTNADARIPVLLDTPASIRFVSCEPLLGPVDLPALDWVIVGGESGPGARPMKPEWARSIRDQCVGAGVPFFFKQWGGVRKKENGRMLDGKIWDQWPPVLKKGNE